MPLHIVQKLAYQCSLKGTVELMRRDCLLPMRATRRLPTLTPTCTAVPLWEPKRTTSSPFVSMAHRAIGAVPFNYVRLARRTVRVDEMVSVTATRHYCKARARSLEHRAKRVFCLPCLVVVRMAKVSRRLAASVLAVCVRTRG